MYSNIRLWQEAEAGLLSKGDVFRDQEGNEIIFTGKSFQVYFTKKDECYEYVGMCAGDEWSYTHNDVRELELQSQEK